MQGILTSQNNLILIKSKFKDLSQHKCNILEAALNQFITNNKKLNKLVEYKCLSEAIVNLEDSKELRNELRQMVSKSRNVAATKMIDLVGCKKFEEVLRKTNGLLYNEKRGGGIWVGKLFKKSRRKTVS